MIVFMLLCMIALFINLYMGLHVLFLNPRHKIHITYFILTMILVEGCLAPILYQLFKSEDQILFVYIHGTSLSVFLPILAVIVSLQLSRLIRLRWFHYAALLIPGAAMAVKNSLTWPYVTFIRYEDSWRLFSIEGQANFNLYCSFFGFFTLVFVVINIIWFFRTAVKREKRQALVLLISLFAATLAFLIYMVLFFNILKLLKYEWIGSGALFYIFWTIGFWICLSRYRLLALTPELVNKDIVSRIEEPILLINTRGEIITVNDKARALLGGDKMEGSSLEPFVPRFAELRTEIENLIKQKASNFACRLNFKNHKSEDILMDARFSLVKDRFGDALGVLVVGREVKELRQLKAFYRITGREAEIVQLLSEGYTNRETAEAVGVTENTLKRHITNIYNKLKVGNKVELMNRLKEFNLIPAQTAERTVLLMARRAR
ncbi:MAG: PAS domain-containing protein [Spirochaetales bacterium]|nr:PAS domain-containing protein [Spirochaetales bacterium]